MNKLKATIAICLGLFAMPQIAFADSVITAVPTAWRLQNYHNDEVVLWFTGASECTSGRLDTYNLSIEDRNRLWSLIMTAKLANHSVGIFYAPANGVCEITSFLMDG